MIHAFSGGRKFAAFIAVSLLIACTNGVLAQTKPKRADLGVDPKAALYVGNSFYYYNNSMHSYVLGLARAGDPARKSDRATSGTITNSQQI